MTPLTRALTDFDEIETAEVDFSTNSEGEPLLRQLVDSANKMVEDGAAADISSACGKLVGRLIFEAYAFLEDDAYVETLNEDVKEWMSCWEEDMFCSEIAKEAMNEKDGRQRNS